VPKATNSTDKGKEIPDLQNQPVQPRYSPKQMFAAFLFKPKGIKFETQEDKEQIVLFMRQHAVVNYGWIVLIAIMILVPIFFFPMLLRLKIFPANTPPGYYLVLPVMWYLGTFGLAFVNFLRWYYNVYIITDQRVVDIDWYNLLYKKFATAQLNRIQDVTYKQGGILDSFFDFGDVFIQTAGEEPNFDFLKIPHPAQVVQQIQQILEETKKPINL
jgi:uncharacterized membrane protein YdbT with pleckstrin-like domain